MKNDSLLLTVNCYIIFSSCKIKSLKKPLMNCIELYITKQICSFITDRHLKMYILSYKVYSSYVDWGVMMTKCFTFSKHVRCMISRIILTYKVLALRNVRPRCHITYVTYQFRRVKVTVNHKRISPLWSKEVGDIASSG